MLIIIFFFLQVLKEGKFTLFRRIFSTTTLLSVVVSHWEEFRSINFVDFSGWTGWSRTRRRWSPPREEGVDVDDVAVASFVVAAILVLLCFLIRCLLRLAVLCARLESKVDFFALISRSVRFEMLLVEFFLALGVCFFFCCCFFSFKLMPERFSEVFLNGGCSCCTYRLKTEEWLVLLTVRGRFGQSQICDF